MTRSNYRTPLGEVREGDVLGSPDGRTVYVRDDETQERVSVPLSRLGDEIAPPANAGAMRPYVFGQS